MSDIQSTILDKRNEGFSSGKKSVYSFGDPEQEPFNKKVLGTVRGEFSKFAKAIIPPFLLPDPEGLPELAAGNPNNLAGRARALSGFIQNTRDAEGLVFINGRQIPGIFQGFSAQGGTVIEKVDQTKVRQGLIKFKDLNKQSKGTQSVFSIDKGLEPVTGSAQFTLLDDLFSTALQKSREFIRIVNFAGPNSDANSAIKSFPRVFKIESFLIGLDRPYNFETIKIPKYSTVMSNRQEGRIDAAFQFEQFDVFIVKDAAGNRIEQTIRKPDTEKKQN